MIVNKIENQGFRHSKREGLLGKGWDIQPQNKEKSFEQYLLEAFQGKLVSKNQPSTPTNGTTELSPMMQANIERIMQANRTT